MNLEFAKIEDEPCAHCTRPKADHDEDTNADNNCPGYESAVERHEREAEESALRTYEAQQEEVNGP